MTNILANFQVSVYKEEHLSIFLIKKDSSHYATEATHEKIFINDRKVIVLKAHDPRLDEAFLICDIAVNHTAKIFFFFLF